MANPKNRGHIELVIDDRTFIVEKRGRGVLSWSIFYLSPGTMENFYQFLTSLGLTNFLPSVDELLKICTSSTQVIIPCRIVYSIRWPKRSTWERFSWCSRTYLHCLLPGVLWRSLDYSDQVDWELLNLWRGYFRWSEDNFRDPHSKEWILRASTRYCQLNDWLYWEYSREIRSSSVCLYASRPWTLHTCSTSLRCRSIVY